ncbi:ferredoxin [Mannheimia granulomatis]|uniref:Ferredoxin-type protein NapF n=1 Tax=Mannheimia granulomatis TaxID=85402 RepID=A0A011LW44_9PAST|nr:ferredoxin-type protein NapF [Mannheimia granulomatis]EXI61428.1 ferredoxin [Mannheimia granulomatis]RGE47657.1 ferredoxin [Mannheimia granulomatis]
MTNISNQSLPRRSFLQGHFLDSLKSEKVSQQGHEPIRPPWANLANFLEKCTACHRCIETCETQILIKGAGGYPEVNFNHGECTFCEKCVQSCEVGVFRETSEEAWTHKINVQPSCLLKRGTECRSCGDSCEMRVIRFRPSLGGIAEMTLNLESCTGCGACVSVCPTGAIQIQQANQYE